MGSKSLLESRYLLGDLIKWVIRDSSALKLVDLRNSALVLLREFSFKINNLNSDIIWVYFPDNSEFFEFILNMV